MAVRRKLGKNTYLLRTYAASDSEDIRNRDHFIASISAPGFMFLSTYSAHHGNKFTDSSLFVLKNGEPFAFMPAHFCESGERLCSHRGLSFGSFAFKSGIKYAERKLCYDLLFEFLLQEGLKGLEIRLIPQPYLLFSNEADMQILHKSGAYTASSKIAVVNDLTRGFKPSKRRLRGFRKAIAHKLFIKEIHSEKETAVFWEMLNRELKARHSTETVHSFIEISTLKKAFPGHIHFFGVKEGNLLLSGCVVFEHKQCAHAQYIFNSEEGRKKGAGDFLFISLLRSRPFKAQRFSFGTSENTDGSLNEDLLAFKEGFGGEYVRHLTYKLDF